MKKKALYFDASRTPAADQRFFLHELFIFVGGIALAIASFMSGSLAATLVSITTYAFVLVVQYGRVGLIHPTAIFTLFFLPYSTWYPYYVVTSGTVADFQVLAQSVSFSHLALVAFHLGTITLRTGRNIDASKWNEPVAKRLSFRLIFFSSSAIVIVATLSGLTSGAGSKREWLESGAAFGGWASFAALIVTAGLVLRLLSLACGGGVPLLRLMRDRWVIIGVVPLLAGLLVLGERDYVFRLGLSWAIVAFGVNRPAGVLGHLLLLALVILVLPVFSGLKAIMLPGGEFTFKLEALSQVFATDFSSASRNLYMLLYYGGAEQGWIMMLNDVVRGILPLSGSLGLSSTGAWYDSVYRETHGFGGVAGWGFTLVGAGLVYGGPAGVIAVMLVTSWLIHGIYLRRERSIFWMCFYLIAICGVIYAIRGDLATVFSQVVKVGGAAVAIYWFGHFVMRKRYKYPSEGR